MLVVWPAVSSFYKVCTTPQPLGVGVPWFLISGHDPLFKVYGCLTALQLQLWSYRNIPTGSQMLSCSGSCKGDEQEEEGTHREHLLGGWCHWQPRPSKLQCSQGQSEHAVSCKCSLYA